MTPYKPPSDPALHALWVIRNWTATPIGNLTTYEDIVRKVHRLASETLTAPHPQTGENHEPIHQTAIPS